MKDQLPWKYRVWFIVVGGVIMIALNIALLIESHGGTP